MILQTGMRTDIPAFYSDLFINRIREGYVLVRNPYNQSAVIKYQKVFLGIFLFIAVHSTIKPPLSTIIVENQRR